MTACSGSIARAIVLLLAVTVCLQTMLLLRQRPLSSVDCTKNIRATPGVHQLAGQSASYGARIAPWQRRKSVLTSLQRMIFESPAPPPPPPPAKKRIKKWWIRPPPPPPVWETGVQENTGTPSASWAVKEQLSKAGAGLLFFAYGGKQLKHFLNEAKTAAASFRRLNPNLSIAIVTNADRVDNATFDLHIQPRPDLLFAGSLTNGDWNDKLPRQWLTRLYYLAHSPYAITWALDSNVYACTPSSAQGFLDGALATGLWGYDIAHANQRDGPMYPHNFNVVYKWSPRTSALLRDWLLLQIRRGVASDDQKTLHFAELRQALSGGLYVGQVATEYAAAFYNAAVFRSDNASDRARVTRVLRGPAHVLHSKNPSDCYDFNLYPNRTRQIVMIAHKPKGAVRSTINYRTVFSVDDCEITLAGGGVTTGLIEQRKPPPPPPSPAPPSPPPPPNVTLHYAPSLLRNASFSSGPARAMCKFRDIGPRVSPELHEFLLFRAEQRHSSSQTIKWINGLLSERALPRPPSRHDGRNASADAITNDTMGKGTGDAAQHDSPPLWPPILPAQLELTEVSKFFGSVDALD